MPKTDLETYRHCRKAYLREARAERDESNEDGMRDCLRLARHHHAQALTLQVFARLEDNRAAAVLEHAQ